MSKENNSKESVNSALRKTVVRRCCHLGCRSKATHSIYYSKQCEDYSDFCGKHLHQYLPNNYNVNVSPIMSDGNNVL